MVDSFRSKDDGKKYKLIKSSPYNYVSNDGVVRKVYDPSRGSTLKKPYAEVGGYVTISLMYGKNKRKTHMVHRLVWEAWKGPIPKGMWVNHKDGDKHNNHISNLEVTTPSENHYHASRILKRNYAKGEKSHSSVLTENSVRSIRARANSGMSQRDIAAVFNVSQPSIQAVITRKTWKHV